MSEEQNRISEYHDRVAETAERLAESLRENGLEPTIAMAQVEANDFNHGYRYLMSQACGVLFRTSDPELMEPGLGYMAWEAEHFPSTAIGDSISYDAKYDARTEEGHDFAGRCFEISLMNFRFAAKADGFVPNAKFFEDFGLAVARMEEEGYPELYKNAITEFAPLAIKAAEIYEPVESEESTGTDFDKYSIDDALSSVIHVLRTTQPETAKRARELITDPSIEMYVDAAEYYYSLNDAFINSEFDKAYELLSTKDKRPLVQGIWYILQQRLLKQEEGYTEWSNKVLDTLLEVLPDYFSSKQYPDMFNGRAIGFVAGTLDRRDIIDDLINLDADPHATGQTAAGVATGYGLTENRDGLEHLYAQTGNYPDYIIESLLACFDIGLKEATDRATATQEA